MFDVVVVGAGLSGLQAAYSAQKAGLSVVVVEARDRVGGKVWSVPLASERGNADLGAAWVNDSLQKRIWTLVEQFGLQTVKQRLTGTAVLQTEEEGRILFPFGITPDFTPEEKKNLEKIRDHIQEKSLRKEAPLPEDDNVTLDQYIRNLGAGPKTIKMVNLWTRVMHGIESTQESAAWFIDYCRTNHGLLAVRADDHTGGNYMRITTGAQRIPEGLADLIGSSHIHLNAPVASIDDRKTHVTVTTTDGRAFIGRKAILSIPSTMYQGLNISPPLPPAAQEVYNNTILGHYNKAIVAYDRPFWRDHGFNGFAMSYKGPISVIRDTSVDDKGLFALTCFVNGTAGAEWAARPPHERRKLVLDQIAGIYGLGRDSEAYKPIEIFDQIWKHEPYSQGALAPVTALGHYTKFADVYGKPVGNLHFVGTEYSREWKGYMEGALWSGEKGAKEAADALQSQKVPSKL